MTLTWQSGTLDWKSPIVGEVCSSGTITGGPVLWHLYQDSSGWRLALETDFVTVLIYDPISTVDFQGGSSNTFVNPVWVSGTCGSSSPVTITPDAPAAPNFTASTSYQGALPALPRGTDVPCSPAAEQFPSAAELNLVAELARLGDSGALEDMLCAFASGHGNHKGRLAALEDVFAGLT